MARIEAERRLLQAQIKMRPPRKPIPREHLNAKLIEIRNLRRRIEESESSLRKARNHFKSLGGPFASHLIPILAPSDPRTPGKDFRFRGNDEGPPLPGDDFPIPKPEPRRPFEFDQPLIDRTIG
jgi:hypothetical protein